jgi:heterotetrameric sarcosine oxidase gamma subunit
MAALRNVAFDSQLNVRGEPPLAPNTCTDTELWLGPDEWLVLNATEADFALACDVSANRAVLELSGPDARTVLATGTPIDLRELQPGRCAQTLLARTQVILQCTTTDTFRIFVRPSYANYLRAWLEDACAAPQ